MNSKPSKTTKKSPIASNNTVTPMKNENKSSVVKPIQTDLDKETEVLEQATGNNKVGHDGGKGVGDSGAEEDLTTG